MTDKFSCTPLILKPFCLKDSENDNTTLYIVNVYLTVSQRDSHCTKGAEIDLDRLRNEFLSQ